MAQQAPTLTGIHLVVRDMDAALAFYRRLGAEISVSGGDFARASFTHGIGIEFGTAKLTRSYDPGWRDSHDAGPNTLNFTLASRTAVDDLYADLTQAGYHAHLAPIDAFWGSRFAIVDDPEGNAVGLHSPPDDAMRWRPPL